MSRAQKHSYSRQDTLPQEVNILLGEDRRQEAIERYQAKCGCSAESAIQFVEDVDRQRRRVRLQLVYS